VFSVVGIACNMAEFPNYAHDYATISYAPLCFMLHLAYYAKNYASIIGASLICKCIVAAVHSWLPCRALKIFSADSNMHCDCLKRVAISIILRLQILYLRLEPHRFIYFIYLLVLYEAERPASKVCGQPVPTARKYSVHT